MTSFNKTIVPALAASFVMLAIVASASADPVTNLYDPPAGSRWTIHTEAREDDTREGPTKTTVIARTAEFAVQEKTALGFRITYMLRDVDIQGGSSETTLANIVLKALRGVVIQAATDPNGKPVRIENFPEVQAAYQKATYGMLAAFAGHPDVAAKARAMLDAMMPRDADKAAESYLDDLPLLAAAQNTHLSLGQVREASHLSPNPFGGEPMKTNTTLRLIENDSATGRQRLIRTAAYDPVALKSFALALAGKLGLPAEAEKIMRQISMSLDDRTEFTVEHGMTREVSEDSMLTVTGMGHTMSKHERTVVTVTPRP